MLLCSNFKNEIKYKKRENSKYKVAKNDDDINTKENDDNYKNNSYYNDNNNYDYQTKKIQN
jgi:hypothetical protein